MNEQRAALETADEQAFAAFFTGHRAAAQRQAQRLVDNRDLAEDIVAEAFARLWRHWRTGVIDEPARYLSRIIRNAAMDHFRRAGRERDAIARATGHVEIASDSVTAGVEARATLAALLKQVSPTQRSTVSLRYLRDLSEAQTAQQLGVSLGTVKSSASRGLQRMRAASLLDAAA